MSRSYDSTNTLHRRELLLGAFGFFRRTTISLADARFRIVRNGGSPRRYIHIHGNEPTAREVLSAHMRRHSGTAFFIEGNERNVRIGSGLLDPNRMFTREGADRNLRTLNPAWTSAQIDAALDQLDDARERLLKEILPRSGALLIAVHNNAQGYSVKDEIPISDQVSVRRAESPHEFFLCTQPADFHKLAASPYNVVLQNQPKGPEDGSLSRLAARRGLRYVNLECGIGKAAIQTEMLEWAAKNL